jgi:adenylosuccinate synthase
MTEALRDVVKETTDLLREISVQQAQQIVEQGKQISELKELVSDVKELQRRFERLEGWSSNVDQLLSEICKQQAVDEYSRNLISRDEQRAYQERRSTAEKIFDIAVKLAGVGALIVLLIE